MTGGAGCGSPWTSRARFRRPISGPKTSRRRLTTSNFDHGPRRSSIWMPRTAGSGRRAAGPTRSRNIGSAPGHTAGPGPSRRSPASEHGREVTTVVHAAAPAIEWISDTQELHLRNDQLSYVMRVHEGMALGQLHFGAPLAGGRSYAHLAGTFAGFSNRLGDPITLEYPTGGSGDYRIPAVVVEHAD